jgi:hypothetical protein
MGGGDALPPLLPRASATCAALVAKAVQPLLPGGLRPNIAPTAATTRAAKSTAPQRHTQPLLPANASCHPKIWALIEYLQRYRCATDSFWRSRGSCSL